MALCAIFETRLLLAYPSLDNGYLIAEAIDYSVALSLVIIYNNPLVLRSHNLRVWT